MAHGAQQQWCNAAAVLFADHFRRATVVDFGALDINGCNRPLFHDCDYTGVDLDAGRNVDVISRAHLWIPPRGYVDTVITTEMLEHDQHWRESLQHAVDILRPGGLLVFTCATTGRPEHGTARTTPGDSPFTQDYYHNLTQADVESIPGWCDQFAVCRFDVLGDDLRFWGLKRAA